jgi:pimeloyl-ACP methyl ester carboxylesterase/predicted glycosyltransferase
MSEQLDRGGGVSIAWEAQGDGAPPILLLPTWSIAPSRVWKLQVPYLAQHHRVISFDGRGSGASSRPAHAGDYADEAFVADALAVLDAAGVQAAVVVALSMGARWAVQLAAAHPDRVLGLVAFGPALPLARAPAGWPRPPFDSEPEGQDGWARCTRRGWRRDYPGFLAFFFAQMFSEPHSHRPIEDAVEWGLDIGEPALELTLDAPAAGSRELAAACRALRCPVLVLHGDDDRIVPHAWGEALARLTGGELVTVRGGGHGIHARHPVLATGEIHAFAERLAAGPAPGGTRPRARRRPRRALFVSSPIGLGHARRDLAIARELRARVPGLRIDWLAQEPTRRALQAAGEHVHPASGRLCSEAAVIDAWGGDHELWAFEAIRRMDEVLLTNYLVFRDVAREAPYDLWIGDEAWELDHFLHENPQDKRAPFAWLTDFVGWLPLPEHGEREALLAADLNAEMLEHVERFPSLRDRSLFVGDPEDIVGDAFGPGLPAIRAWTERHFAFTGQIVEVERGPAGDGDGPLCLVSAGGSGVGATLLHRAAAALPQLRERVPGARMLIVTGPRVDPAAIAPAEGLEVAGYVPDLGRRLAGCDVALVHGGLSTAMELIAHGRPFVSVPLRRHFEQQRHVRHRLERHGHRRVVDAGAGTPARLAAELAGALATAPAYRPVAGTGAARAAELLAELL